MYIFINNFVQILQVNITLFAYRSYDEIGIRLKMLNPIYLSPRILVSAVTLKVSGETIPTTRCNFHPWAVRFQHRERLPRIPSPGRFVRGTKANFACKTESCLKPVKLNWHARNFSLYVRTQQKFVLFVRLCYTCAISPRYRERMTLIFLFHRRSTRGERGRIETWPETEWPAFCAGNPRVFRESVFHSIQ